MSRLRHLMLTTALALSALSGPAAAPSLAGIWFLDSKLTTRLDPATAPLTPAARAFWEQNRDRNLRGALQSENHVRCLPHGVPDIMTSPFAIEILDAPGKIVMLAEISSLPRFIYLDQPRPDDVQPTWNGYSAGRWDGQALVIDTTDFNDRVAYILGIGLIVRRTPDLKLHERMWLSADGDTLMDEMTVTEPRALTRPVTVTYAYRRLPAGSRLMEYACEPDPNLILDYERQYGPEKPF